MLVAPNLWAQVYTVHALLQGYTIPAVYALLPDKKQTTYFRMWEGLFAKLGELLEMPNVYLDFEKAACG